MIIRGDIATYNPASGQNVFVLYDKNGCIFDRHHVMHLSFLGVQLVQSVKTQEDCKATLVLQVDLNRISELICFTRSGRRLVRRAVADSTLQRNAVYAKDWVWLILFSIGCGFTSPAGGLFAGASKRLRSSIMPISEIHTLSDGIISVVEEYAGLPKNGNWISLPRCRTSAVMGGNMYQAASYMAGVSVDDVRKVLSAVATVAIDTGVKAILSGATAAEFYIPPLGTLMIRPANTAQQELSVEFSTLADLNYEANTLYSEGTWRPVEVMSKIMNNSMHGRGGRESIATRSRAHRRK